MVNISGCLVQWFSALSHTLNRQCATSNAMGCTQLEVVGGILLPIGSRDWGLGIPAIVGQLTPGHFAASF